MTKDLKHLIYYLYRRRPLAGGPQVCPSKKPVSNSSTLVTSPSRVTTSSPWRRSQGFISTNVFSSKLQSAVLSRSGSNPLIPNLLPRWCISGIWEMSGGKRVILTEAELSKVHEKIDLAFLRHLLRLIPDHVAMRDNTALAHTNARNLICRFQFSAFVFQDRGLVMDLLVFGL